MYWLDRANLSTKVLVEAEQMKKKMQETLDQGKMIKPVAWFWHDGEHWDEHELPFAAGIMPHVMMGARQSPCDAILFTDEILIPDKRWLGTDHLDIPRDDMTAAVIMFAFTKNGELIFSKQAGVKDTVDGAVIGELEDMEEMHKKGMLKALGM